MQNKFITVAKVKSNKTYSIKFYIKWIKKFFMSNFTVYGKAVIKYSNLYIFLNHWAYF